MGKEEPLSNDLSNDLLKNRPDMGTERLVPVPAVPSDNFTNKMPSLELTDVGVVIFTTVSTS